MEWQNFNTTWENSFRSMTTVRIFIILLNIDQDIAESKSLELNIDIFKLPKKGRVFDQVNPSQKYSKWLIFFSGIPCMYRYLILEHFVYLYINDYVGDAEEALNAPQNKHLRIENKNFYFDIKRNQQGRYMSILEVNFQLL